MCVCSFVCLYAVDFYIRTLNQIYLTIRGQEAGAMNGATYGEKFVLESIYPSKKSTAPSPSLLLVYFYERCSLMVAAEAIWLTFTCRRTIIQRETTRPKKKYR